MKINEKKSSPVPFIAAFCFIYIILSARPLSTELHLKPEWTESIQNVKPVIAKEELIPFRLSQNIGYFTKDGRIVSCISFPFKATISDSRFAYYGADSQYTEFRTPDAKIAGRMDTPGFPFFEEDRMYMFFPGGTSFGMYAEDGSQLWKYESYAPVTAFSSSTGGTVAGFADGTLVSFDNSGNQTQRFSPGGSTYEVILGAGISQDGSRIACVSGQDKQRFVVAEKNSGHSRVIFHEYIENSQNFQVLVKFSSDSKTVWYDAKGFLGIANLDTLKSSRIPIDGRIIQIEESAVENIIFVLSRNADTYTVTAIEPSDHKLSSFSFTGSSAFIQVRGNMLFVGRDDRISKISVSRE